MIVRKNLPTTLIEPELNYGTLYECNTFHYIRVIIPINGCLTPYLVCLETQEGHMIDENSQALYTPVPYVLSTRTADINNVRGE